MFLTLHDRGDNDVPHMLAVLFVGVTAFALIFAINSSVHSYLVLRYAEGDKVSTSVGFYYMANAGLAYCRLRNMKMWGCRMISTGWLVDIQGDLWG